MSFLKGSVTARRYKFDSEILADEDWVKHIQLQSHERRIAMPETVGVEVGWTGGSDHLDSNFDPDRLIRGAFLAFGFRVCKKSIPAQELKARTRVELDALTKDGRKPNKELRRDAKEAAMGYLEQLGEDGRFNKYVHIPVVIDTATRQVWYGHTSHTYLVMFGWLFEKTFGVDLSVIDPSGLADLPDYPTDAPKWVQDTEAKNAWGTRWAESLIKDAIAGVQDYKAGSETVTIMVQQSLAMGSPQADKGSCVFRDTLPDRMKEAKLAIMEGKLPTSLGLEMAVHGEDGTTKFTLSPHEWVVSGAGVAKADEGDPSVKEHERLLKCQSFFQVLDNLFVGYASNLKGDENDMSGNDEILF
jgi:hypothetical protein